MKPFSSKVGRWPSTLWCPTREVVGLKEQTTVLDDDGEIVSVVQSLLSETNAVCYG